MCGMIGVILSGDDKLEAFGMGDDLTNAREYLLQKNMNCIGMVSGLGYGFEWFMIWYVEKVIIWWIIRGVFLYDLNFSG